MLEDSLIKLNSPPPPQIDFDAIFDLNPNLADNAIQKDNQMGNNKKLGQAARQSYAQAKGSLRMKNNSMAARNMLNNTGFSNFKEPQLPTVNYTSNGGSGFGNLAPTPLNSTQNAKSHFQMSNNLSSNHNNNNNDFGNLKSGAQGQQSAASRRRSNVVKEVDRIKKQREERRYRQAEQKAEKCELMSSVEPGKFANSLRLFGLFESSKLRS